MQAVVLKLRTVLATGPSPIGRGASEYGTYKTVTARFWPWLPGKSPYNLPVVPIGVDSTVLHG